MILVLFLALLSHCQQPPTPVEFASQGYPTAAATGISSTPFGTLSQQYPFLFHVLPLNHQSIMAGPAENEKFSLVVEARLGRQQSNIDISTEVRISEQGQLPLSPQQSYFRRFADELGRDLANIDAFWLEYDSDARGSNILNGRPSLFVIFKGSLQQPPPTGVYIRAASQHLDLAVPLSHAEIDAALQDTLTSKLPQSQLYSLGFFCGRADGGNNSIRAEVIAPLTAALEHLLLRHSRHQSLLKDVFGLNQSAKIVVGIDVSGHGALGLDSDVGEKTGLILTGPKQQTSATWPTILSFFCSRPAFFHVDEDKCRDAGKLGAAALRTTINNPGPNRLLGNDNHAEFSHIKVVVTDSLPWEVKVYLEVRNY